MSRWVRGSGWLLAIVLSASCLRAEGAQADNWRARIASKDLDAEQFTRLFIEAARERWPGATVEKVGPLQVRIARKDSPYVWFLDNAWRAAQYDPTHRVELVERRLKLAEAPPDTGTDRKSRIVPVIKDDDFVASLAQFGSKGDLARQRYVGDLWILYAIDAPDAFSYLSREKQRELGLTDAQLRALAEENLKRLIPRIQRHGDGPVYMLSGDGSYEASLLLQNDVWNDLATQVEGELVVAVPARDIVLVTGSLSKVGLELVRQMVAKTHENGDHLISRSLFVRRRGAWVPFELAPRSGAKAQ